MWMMKTRVVDEHREARQFVLYHTLSRVADPVVVLGDSIVEASTLPRSICGHPIVNGGLGGASTASDLANWLAAALDGKRAALIMVSLGTNDALRSAPKADPEFAKRYGALLAQLAKLTPKLAVMEIPPLEARGRMTPEIREEAMAIIDQYNSTLPQVARESGATFVALPTMTQPHTIDGVHLSATGYASWDSAVTQAATAICG
jgi:lysophospholipase L1-like esterase